MQTYHDALQLQSSLNKSLENHQKRLCLEKLKLAKKQSSRLLRELTLCEKPDICALEGNIATLLHKMSDYDCDSTQLHKIKIDVDLLESKLKSYQQLNELHQIKLTPDLKLAKLEVLKLKEHLVTSSDTGGNFSEARQVVYVAVQLAVLVFILKK